MFLLSSLFPQSKVLPLGKSKQVFETKGELSYAKPRLAKSEIIYNEKAWAFLPKKQGAIVPPSKDQLRKRRNRFAIK